MPVYTGGTLYSSSEMAGVLDNIGGKIGTAWEAYKTHDVKSEEATSKQSGVVVWLQNNWKPIVISAAVMGGAYWYLYKRKKKA